MKTKTLALSGVLAALALAGAGFAVAQDSSSSAASSSAATFAGNQPPAPPTTAPDGSSVAAQTPTYTAGAVNSDGNVPIVAQPSTPAPAPSTVYVQGQPQTQVVYAQPQVVYTQPVYAGYPYYGGYYYGPGYGYYGPSVSVGVGFGGYYHGGGYYRGGYVGRGFAGGGRGWHR